MHRYLLTLAIIFVTSHQLNIGTPPCDDQKFARGIKKDARRRPAAVLPDYTIWHYPLIFREYGSLPQMVKAVSTNNARQLKRSLDVLGSTITLQEIELYIAHQPGLSFEQHRRAAQVCRYLWALNQSPQKSSFAGDPQLWRLAKSYHSLHMLSLAGLHHPLLACTTWPVLDDYFNQLLDIACSPGGVLLSKGLLPLVQTEAERLSNYSAVMRCFMLRSIRARLTNYNQQLESTVLERRNLFLPSTIKNLHFLETTLVNYVPERLRNR